MRMRALMSMNKGIIAFQPMAKKELNEAKKFLNES